MLPAVIAKVTVVPLMVPGPAVGATHPLAPKVARKYEAPAVIDGSVILKPGLPASVVAAVAVNSRYSRSAFVVASVVRALCASRATLSAVVPLKFVLLDVSVMVPPLFVAGRTAIALMPLTVTGATVVAAVMLVATVCVFVAAGATGDVCTVPLEQAASAAMSMSAPSLMLDFENGLSTRTPIAALLLVRAATPQHCHRERRRMPADN
jgi:hypothetical protein